MNEARNSPYPSDLTDAEWAVLDPLMPPPVARRHRPTAEVDPSTNGGSHLLSPPLWKFHGGCCRATSHRINKLRPRAYSTTPVLMPWPGKHRLPCLTGAGIFGNIRSIIEAKLKSE